MGVSMACCTYWQNCVAGTEGLGLFLLPLLEEDDDDDHQFENIICLLP